MSKFHLVETSIKNLFWKPSVVALEWSETMGTYNTPDTSERWED